jgi:hypothetical protein
MPKIWKIFLSTLASSFSIVPNYKLLLFLLLKEIDQKKSVIECLTAKPAQVLIFIIFKLSKKSRVSNPL